MRPRVRLAALVGAGLALAVALALVVAPVASREPDGLQRVAADHGFADREADHPLAGSPTAGYAVRGVDDDRTGTGLAGLAGVAVTFAVAGGLLLVVRRTARRRAGPGAGPSGAGRG